MHIYATLFFEDSQGIRIMRYLLIALLQGFLAFTASGCWLREIPELSGKRIITEKKAQNFNSIKVGSGFRLILHMGNEEHVQIEADSALMPYIEMKQTANTLEFKTKKDVYFHDKGNVLIHVNARNIKGIEASGGASVQADTIRNNQIAIALSGGSTMQGFIISEKLDIDQSGGSELDLKGNTIVYTLESSGGSITKGFAMNTDEMNIDISGGGNVEITTNKKLNVDASGGSTIIYKGNGGNSGRQSTSGGSQIIKH
jgi:ribosomal protein S6E (S10)